MNILAKLQFIEDHAIIYNIHYCNAGVGISFFEPPNDYNPGCGGYEWEQFLNTHHYYKDFKACIKAEYKRVKNL